MDKKEQEFYFNYQLAFAEYKMAYNKWMNDRFSTADPNQLRNTFDIRVFNIGNYSGMDVRMSVRMDNEKTEMFDSLKGIFKGAGTSVIMSIRGPEDQGLPDTHFFELLENAAISKMAMSKFGEVRRL